MANKFYEKYKDSSSANIAEAAKFLNKKPARQGSNQVMDSKIVEPTNKKK